MAKHSLKGSERQPLNGATSLGKADPTERLEVTVIVRHHAGEALQEKVKELLIRGRRATPMKREEFAQKFGTDPRDIEAVKQFAKKHSLAVVQEDASRRTVVLSGTVAQFNEAFGVELEQFEHEGGSYRGRKGALYLPDELNGV